MYPEKTQFSFGFQICKVVCRKQKIRFEGVSEGIEYAKRTMFMVKFD